MQILASSSARSKFLRELPFSVPLTVSPAASQVGYATPYNPAISMAHTTFPDDLPVPVDDGACAGLLHTRIPESITLPSTAGTTITLSAQPGLTILFCYPRTGAPGETVPESWNAIPGARGCTPQACSFRDSLPSLQRLGVDTIFGLSTQDTPYQAEAKARLALPYELLSDEKLEFARALKLPTFEWEGKAVTKRVTLAIRDGEIVQVWYPIFPPDKNAEAVVKWLSGGGP